MMIKMISLGGSMNERYKRLFFFCVVLFFTSCKNDHYRQPLVVVGQSYFVATLHRGKFSLLLRVA
jgi:hypothetical protein